MNKKKKNAPWQSRFCVPIHIQ